MEFPPPPTEENTNDPTPLTAASFQIYDHSLGHGTTFFPDRRNMIPFLSSPVPCSQKIQCIITRYRTGIHKWAPGYELFLQFGQQRFFLLSARKKKMQHATTYYMYSQPLPYISKYSLIAKLKSNWMGTVFTLTGPSYMGSDHVKRKDELAAILYDTNVLGFKGPRKMKLVLPRVNKEGIPFRITPNDVLETLLHLFFFFFL
ncbi:Tubby- protein 3 [Coelomomyces lativittatus]|nr:Tubby- protein 3 [Coelomomyces lativittatus]